MVDIAAALSAIAQGIGIAKELSQISGEIDKADLKLRIADLSGSLASAQITLAEAQTELSGKDAEIEKLKENFRLKEETMELKGYRYRKAPDGTAEGPPYCDRCLTVDGMLILTTRLGRGDGVRCPQCNAEYPRATTFVYFTERRA